MGNNTVINMIIEITVAFIAGVGVSIVNKYVVNNPSVTKKLSKMVKCCRKIPKEEEV